MQIKVVQFGGSSLADAAHFKQVVVISIIKKPLYMPDEIVWPVMPRATRPLT